MSPPRSSSSQGMEENLKKAVIEMLVMMLLDEEDMYSVQITQALEERSGSTLNLSFPYALLYRLIEKGYICEAYKKTPPTGGGGSITRSRRRAGNIWAPCWPLTGGSARVWSGFWKGGEAGWRVKRRGNTPTG